MEGEKQFYLNYSKDLEIGQTKLGEAEVRELKESKEIKELPHVEAVIVLGGTLEYQFPKAADPEKRGRIEPGLESKMRMLGGLELLRRGIAEKIIITGGVPAEFPEYKSLALAMKEWMVETYGIPESQILVEEESKNTTQNMENTLELMKREGIETAIVTSNEFHLRRAKPLIDTFMNEYKVENARISAEALLDERSKHYNRPLTSFYKWPTNLKRFMETDGAKTAFQKVVKKGILELVRQGIYYIDRKDKIFTAISEYRRSTPEEQTAIRADLADKAKNLLKGKKEPEPNKLDE